jgi:alpha-L-rhamnosidase
MDIEIPVNTTATIYIPVDNKINVTESGKQIDAVKDITVKGNEDGYVIVNVGSGKYHFVR